MNASACAASYRAAHCSPPIRSAGIGSTAFCAVSAMTRAEASRSPLRRTTRLMRRASAETVRTVMVSVRAATSSTVPL
ncbi:hypothetical protein STANM309S_04745 [Streptomyces tanashiensis]